MTGEELADYLAKGGKINACPLDASAAKVKKARVLDPWWVRTKWTLVKVEASRIDAASSWLRERQINHYINRKAVGGTWHVRLEKADDAVLFKLTWGGAV